MLEQDNSLKIVIFRELPTNKRLTYFSDDLSFTERVSIRRDAIYDIS